MNVVKTINLPGDHSNFSKIWEDVKISTTSGAIEPCEKAAGEFLHRLGKDKPDMSDVRKIIAIYPKSMLCENKFGEVPIQSALKNTSSIKYIPLLAEEAFIRNMFGVNRGGLLLPLMSRPSSNILQWLVYSWTRADSVRHEDSCLQALKDLRRMKLLRDDDYDRFDLIGNAICYITTLRRLTYLLEINPTSISAPSANGDLPIHCSCKNDPADACIFGTLLKISMIHHSEEFGFLFRQNAAGERSISLAIKKFGKDTTMQIIQKHIPSNETYPILHKVFLHTPDLMDDFIYRYPDAIFLKDRRDRLLLHTAAEKGIELSSFLFMMVHCNKQSLDVRDPVTNLYPFMLAASGEKKDLTTIYKLLSLSLETVVRCMCART